MPAGHETVDQTSVVVESRVGLGDDVLSFLYRRKVVDLIADLSRYNFAIRCFQKSVSIRARIYRERIYEANVWAFGRLDRAQPTIMGRMNIPNFKPGPLARQSARAERRHTAFVRDLESGLF